MSWSTPARTTQMLSAAALAAWCGAWSAPGPPQHLRPTFDGKVALFFGNLHAHSALSRDVPAADRPHVAPATAYAYALDHGLDFLALSDHHKASDSPHPLRLDSAEYVGELFDLARSFCQAHEGEFVAIPGIEWGNTATGNHLNVLVAPTLPPDAILDRRPRSRYSPSRRRRRCS